MAAFLFHAVFLHKTDRRCCVGARQGVDLRFFLVIPELLVLNGLQSFSDKLL